MAAREKKQLLARSAQEASQLANISVGPPSSVTQYLNGAENLQKQATQALLDSRVEKDDFKAALKREDAYIWFMKMCNIVLQLEKHPGWAAYLRSVDVANSRYLRLRQEAHRLVGVLEQLRPLLAKDYNELAMRQQVDRMTSPQPQKQPTLNALSNNTPPNKKKRPMNTPDRISAKRLYDYLGMKHASKPRILVLDIRPRDAYQAIHIQGCHVANIDPALLLANPTGIHARDLEFLLPIRPEFHRTNFSQRHEFDLVIYMDQGSESKEQNPALVVLERLLMLQEDDSSGEIDESLSEKVLKRRPALLVGGWAEWRRTASTAPVKMVDGIGFGDTDGIILNTAAAAAAATMGTHINRSATDYLAQSAGVPKIPPASPSSSSFGSATMNPTQLLYQPPTVPPGSRFEDPFNNFTSGIPNQFDTSLPSTTHARPSLYPSQVSALTSQLDQLNMSSAPPALPPKDGPRSTVLPANIPQRLQMVPSAPLLPTAPPIQQQQQSYHLHPPPQSHHHAPIMTRAPSPPSPGASSSALTIHMHLRTDGALDLSREWHAAGGDSGRGFVGLKNMGNTCYMNSILQCLMATRPLCIFFYDGRYKREVNTDNPLGSKGKMALAFAGLVTQVAREENGVTISPSAFREAVCALNPMFKGAEQHDSQEFLATLLDGLHEDMNQGTAIRGGRGHMLHKYTIPAYAQNVTDGDDDDDRRWTGQQAADRAWVRYLRRNDSLIVELFQGQLQSQLRCQTCGTTSTTYNPFMYLSLPIPSPSRNGGGVTLEDCLREFGKAEVLDEADQWRCPRCNVPRRATKTMRICRLPVILLVHLKRFSVSSGGGGFGGGVGGRGMFRDKLDTFVDFPTRGLDLTHPRTQVLAPEFLGNNNNANSNSMQGRSRYDLYAVSNHYGGLNGGHYTAFVRHLARGAWFHFDDSRVTELCATGGRSGGGGLEKEREKVVTRAAYSLFYVCSEHIGGGG